MYIELYSIPYMWCSLKYCLTAVEHVPYPHLHTLLLQIIGNLPLKFRRLMNHKTLTLEDS